MAPFIMDFGDLNRFVLRDESSTDPLQLLVNAHTREDEHRRLAAIVLDDAGRARAEALVDEVFALFAAWIDELLAYARDELTRPAEAAA